MLPPNLLALCNPQDDPSHRGSPPSPRHDDRRVANPNHTAILANDAILSLKPLPALARFFRGLHNLVIIGMNVLRPRPRILQPLFRRKCTHSLNLRPDV